MQKKELEESQAKSTPLEREINDLKNALGNQEIVMGLEVNVMLTVNDASAETDEDKVELLLNFLEPGTAINIS